MAESTLSLSRDDLRSEIGFFLGFGQPDHRDSANWSSVQTETIDTILNAGLRQFYYPKRLEGDRKVHEWTFLRPTRTQLTVVDQGDYNLPDDFGGLEGNLTFATNDDAWVSVTITSEQQIRELRQITTTNTGWPRLAAVRPILTPTAGATGTRYELLIWPEPDAIYTLSYRFNIMPEALTSGLPFPHGGLVHAETILESCLAVAERRLDDYESTYHHEMFTELLEASIQNDRALQVPHTLGYNADGSDDILSTRDDRYDGVTSYISGSAGPINF